MKNKSFLSTEKNIIDEEKGFIKIKRKYFNLEYLTSLKEKIEETYFFVLIFDKFSHNE